MSHAPDELALLAEIADLIEQGCERPYRKAGRILRMVRLHDAEARDRQIIDRLAAHPDARPVLFADLPSPAYATCPALIEGAGR